ncbi:MAG: Stk1 family PASTA domain-containing Ser/Thr kinase [Lachnospiraceae bacterium]
MKKEVILGERYEVLSKIGTGGMADVYKGKDTMLNRFIAIKVLKKEYREDENFVRKFRSEAQAAAGLMHPNIVNVYDVGEDRGLYYMIMELVEGITLKSYVDKKGALSPREVISIAIQMCAGIDAAHTHHIIHRDIKPQNIMISKDGKVKVTDFGIARAASSHTVSSNVMGSVHYTSPEQARGGISDAKSDIYSVGITLYEMATGELPYDGDSTVAIAVKHLQEEITPPSEHVEDIPYSLEQIILKCTMKSADKRYASIPELVQDLKRSLVDPDGDFVKLEMYPRGSQTIMMTSDELSEIQEKYQDVEEDEEYDDEEDDFDVDDDDLDDDDLDDDDDDEESTKGGKVNKRMNKVMKILTIAVAVILLLVVVLVGANMAGWFKSGDSTTASEDMSKVPNVVGETEEDAREMLDAVDLGFQVSGREASDKYEEGYVISQDVDEGTEVKKETIIHVVVSTGPSDEKETISVPDVSGMNEDEARKALINKGFLSENISTDYDYSDDVSSGEVIKTSPAAGSDASEDTEITIWVSKGAKKAEKVSVPSIVGKSESEAKSAITSAGLTVGSISEEYSDSYEAGVVISQNPSSGSKVEAGTSVSYTVSKGAKPADTVRIPSNITGMTLANAKSALENLGLVVNSKEVANSSEAGIVVDCSPEPGTSVEVGSTVTISYSDGSVPQEEVAE